jgi:hypothetical protein
MSQRLGILDHNRDSDADTIMEDARALSGHQAPPLPPRHQNPELIGRRGSIRTGARHNDCKFRNPENPGKGPTHTAINMHREGQQYFPTDSGTTKILVDSTSVSIEVRPRTRSSSPMKMGPVRLPTDVSTKAEVDGPTKAQVDTVTYPNLSIQDLRSLWQEEKHQRVKCQHNLERSSEDFRGLQNSLEEERRIREEAEKELVQKNIELDGIRKRWKQTARELDKFRVQGQGFYQVTDRYLIQLATQLRYNIRSFAIQYFEGDLHNEWREENTSFWDYMCDTTSGTKAYQAYLMSPSRCSSIIQSFLWRVLKGRIFGKFRWAGRVSEHARKLCIALRPRECGHETTI